MLCNNQQNSASHLCKIREVFDEMMTVSNVTISDPYSPQGLPTDFSLAVYNNSFTYGCKLPRSNAE